MDAKKIVLGAALAGIVGGASLLAAPAAHAADAKVHCAGVNACKGKGSCHSATNACSGQNGCKGKGMMEMTEKECKAKKGTVMKEEKKG